jgi:hypothetical protein
VLLLLPRCAVLLTACERHPEREQVAEPLRYPPGLRLPASGAMLRRCFFRRIRRLRTRVHSSRIAGRRGACAEATSGCGKRRHEDACALHTAKSRPAGPLSTGYIPSTPWLRVHKSLSLRSVAVQGAEAHLAGTAMPRTCADDPPAGSSREVLPSQSVRQSFPTIRCCTSMEGSRASW